MQTSQPQSSSWTHPWEIIFTLYDIVHQQNRKSLDRNFVNKTRMEWQKSKQKLHKSNWLKVCVQSCWRKFAYIGSGYTYAPEASRTCTYCLQVNWRGEKAKFPRGKTSWPTYWTVTIDFFPIILFRYLRFLSPTWEENSDLTRVYRREFGVFPLLILFFIYVFTD